MNKAVPWNINGVGFDAREAAREAARRQGKSLGEWLHGVIAEHAADLGVAEDDVNNQARVDAVTSRLERLSARSEGGPRHRSERARERTSEHERDRSARGDRFSEHSGNDYDGHDEGHDDGDRHGELAPRYRRSSKDRFGGRTNSRDVEEPMDRYRADQRSYRSKAAIDETELLLEEAVEAMERRAMRAERKTDKALASFAKIIETTENKHDDERDMFSALARKLTDIETRITTKPDDDNYRPIKGALARLEARLDALGRRVQNDAPAAFGYPDALPAEPKRAVASPPVAVAPSVDNEPIERLEGKLNSILEALHAVPSALVAAAQSASPEPVRSRAPASFAPPPPSAEQRLGDAIADIANHQRALDRPPARRVPRQDSYRQDGYDEQQPLSYQPNTAVRLGRALTSARSGQPMPADNSGAINRLQREMVGLASKIEALHRDFVARDESRADADTVAARIDDLIAEVAALSKVSEEQAPRSALPGQAVQMSTALDMMRRDLIKSQAATHKVAALPSQAASRSDIEDLKAEMSAITRTLGQLVPRERTVARDEPLPRAALYADDYEARERAAVAHDEPMPRAAVRADGYEVPEKKPRSIRDTPIGWGDEPASGVPTIDSLGRKIATLSEKLERRPRLEAQDERAFKAAADEIKTLLQNPPGLALFDKIEQRLEALGAKVDEAVTEASGARQVAEMSRRHFDSMERQLVSRLEADAPKSYAAAQSLESVVRDLSDRIEAVRAPSSGGQALEALQDQVVQLSKRFERADSELSMLPAIERSMQALFAHIENTKASVETSAARVARETAKATLSGGESAAPAAHEIATLKAIQAEADHRTHATLNAVHETLEKVVDRLSLMESDMANTKGARAPVRPAASESRLDPVQQPSPSRNQPAKAQRPPPLPDLMLDASDVLDQPIGPARSADRQRPAPAAKRPLSADLDEGAGRADFIAAARRAARSAQNDPSVLAMKQDAMAAADSRVDLMSKTRDYVATHKKPVLMSIAALFVIVGALNVIGELKIGDGSHQVGAAPPAMTVPKMAEAAPQASNANRAMLADLTPSAIAAPPANGDRMAGSDPITTGSLSRIPSFAAQAVATAPVAPSGSLKQMADAGNAAAQYEIASRYAEGRMLVKDFTLAASWYQKAAQQSLAPAQYKLASLYEKGLGVPRDSAKARFWYTKAAEAGNPRAMHNLAVLIADGDGKPDYAGAVQWFRKAAEYGVHDSQYNLGILLARGLGTPQTLVQSYQWFAVAAEQNDADAATKRDEVGAKMTPNDLAVAKALAAAFHPRTADMAAVEIEPPAGGWDGASSPSLVKSARPKVSSL